MSSRSLSPPDDLESTAELPVLDPASMQSAEAEHASTDTWATLPALRAEGERHLDTTLESLAAQLHAAQQSLAAKNERLLQLERARDEALAARAGAEQRVHNVNTELARLEAAAAAHAAVLAEAQQARAAAEQRLAGLTAELAHLRAGGEGTPPDQLAELRAAAEQRAAELDAELTRLQAAATQHAAQFAELSAARAAAEERATSLDSELAAARVQLAASNERALQQQVQLSEQEKSLEASRAERLEHEQTRAGREKAQATHAAAMIADLHEERARAARYFESLQTTTAQRAIFEELVGDLGQQGEERERDLMRLARELNVRDARLAELHAELAQRAARLTQLEGEMSALSGTVTERDAQLRDGRREGQGLHANIKLLQQQLEASGERIRALTALTDQHNTAESQRKSELSALLSERVELTTALEAARASAAALQGQVNEHETDLSARRARIAELESALEAERKRAGELEEELATARREMEDWGSALKAAHAERGTHLEAVGSAEARAKELERRLAQQDEALRTLQVRVGHDGPGRAELEGEIAAAEAAVERLESEMRSREARIDELEKANQQWRATGEERRAGVADTTVHPALPERRKEVEPAPAPDGATRLLVRADESGREVVYVLGRKTSVGRTPDNDLQIDAKFISRHHAVILAGPVQTIIEDLNSTNGVQVNGRRVTRQTLKDGDQVSIGRQQYRFVIRKGGDRR
jgi:chromosome segregation ATPase